MEHLYYTMNDGTQICRAITDKGGEEILFEKLEPALAKKVLDYLQLAYSQGRFDAMADARERVVEALGLRTWRPKSI